MTPSSLAASLGTRPVTRLVGQPAGPTWQRLSGGDSRVIFGRFEPGAYTVPRSLLLERTAYSSPSTSCGAK